MANRETDSQGNLCVSNLRQEVNERRIKCAIYSKARVTFCLCLTESTFRTLVPSSAQGHQIQIQSGVWKLLGENPRRSHGPTCGPPCFGWVLPSLLQGRIRSASWRGGSAHLTGPHSLSKAAFYCPRRC